MSFARFGENGSDIYLFAHVSGGVNCCGCFLETQVMGAGPFFYDRDSLFAHLHEHEAAGHTVPAYLFDPATYDDEDFEEFRE